MVEQWCAIQSDPMWGNLWLLTNGWQLTVQNLAQLYVLVASAPKNTHRDMTYTVLKVTLKKPNNWELQNCFDWGLSTFTMLVGFTPGLYGAAPCRG